jgi:hypothetical protein
VVTLAEAAQSPEQIGLAETDAWFEPSGLPAVGAITSGANKWANSSSYTTEYDDWIEGQSGQGAVSTASVLDGFKGAVFTGVLTRLVNSQGDPRTAGRSHEVWVLCKWDAADGGTVVNNWHTGSQDRLLQDSSNNLVITRQNTSTTVWATSMDTNWHLIRWQETENGARVCLGQRRCLYGEASESAAELLPRDLRNSRRVATNAFVIKGGRKFLLGRRSPLKGRTPFHFRQESRPMTEGFTERALAVLLVVAMMSLLWVAGLSAAEPTPVFIHSHADVDGIPGSWLKANKIFAGYLEKEGDLVATYELRPNQYEVRIKLWAIRDVVGGGGEYSVQLSVSHRQLDGSRREIAVFATRNVTETPSTAWADIHKWMIEMSKLVRRDINDYQKGLENEAR